MVTKTRNYRENPYCLKKFAIKNLINTSFHTTDYPVLIHGNIENFTRIEKEWFNIAGI